MYGARSTRPSSCATMPATAAPTPNSRSGGTAARVSISRACCTVSSRKAVLSCTSCAGMATWEMTCPVMSASATTCSYALADTPIT